MGVAQDQKDFGTKKKITSLLIPTKASMTFLNGLGFMIRHFLQFQKISHLIFGASKKMIKPGDIVVYRSHDGEYRLVTVILVDTFSEVDFWGHTRSVLGYRVYSDVFGVIDVTSERIKQIF